MILFFHNINPNLQKNPNKKGEERNISLKITILKLQKGLFREPHSEYYISIYFKLMISIKWMKRYLMMAKSPFYYYLTQAGVGVC